VRVATDNVLDLFSRIEPSKIVTKPKLHLLTHLPDDIKRYGPLVGEATETFECFNAVFRFCSVLSNHQAPSRDIAIQLADQEGFKQRVTGGWWFDGSGDLQRSGTGVRSSLGRYATLRNNLGWAEDTVTPPGLFPLGVCRTLLTSLIQVYYNLLHSWCHKLRNGLDRRACGDLYTLLRLSTRLISVGTRDRCGSLGSMQSREAQTSTPLDPGCSVLPQQMYVKSR